MIAKFVQPDSTTQTGTTYKGSIDAAVAVLAEQAAQFAVSAQDTPDMTLYIRGGRIFQPNGTVLVVNGGNTGVQVAPTTNPRNDIWHYNLTTGVIGVNLGIESASPVDPSVPANNVPIARVRWTVGMTSITNSVIDDLRSDVNIPADNGLPTDMEEMAIANLSERGNAKNFPLLGVVHDGVRFIAVGFADGTDAYICRSTGNGYFWGELSNPKNVNLRDIAWNGSMLVAVGDPDGGDAYIVTSTDSGSTWTERVNPKNITLYAIAWSSGLSLWVAVGDSDGTDAYILTSPDGVTWTERSNPKNTVLYSVEWSQELGLLVAVGNGVSQGDAYILTSPDGVTWTERSNPKAITLYDIAWSPRLGLFVAVGAADAADTYVLSSSDGVTWTEVTNPGTPSLQGVCWTGRMFVAVGSSQSPGGDSYIVLSSDGVTWIDSPSTSESTNSVNSLLYAVALGQVGNRKQIAIVGDVNAGASDAKIMVSQFFK